MASVVGIDTLAFRAPVHHDTLAMLPRQRLRRDVDLDSGLVTDINTSSEVLVADGVTARADVWRGRSEVVIECSLPNFLRGDNTHALSVDEAPRAVHQLWEAAGRQVRWMAGPDEVTLTRLDLVRDFVGVERPHAHLRGLFDVPAVRATTHAYGADGAGVQTLYRETTRWRTRLYDRQGVYGAPSRALRTAAEADRMAGLRQENVGRLRYELQLRGAALLQVGMRSLPDCTTKRAEEVARRYFERSRFDTRVGDPLLKLATALNRLDQEGRGKLARGMAGQLLIDAVGRSPATDATSVKYRKQAQQFGLSASEFVAPRGAEGLRQLDFEAGQLVSGLAA